MKTHKEYKKEDWQPLADAWQSAYQARCCPPDKVLFADSEAIKS